MKISIITVSFNAEKTIEATINSVLSQSCKNVEYIIKDGASKDKTMEIVNNYKQSISSIISSKDAGLYDAMNLAVREATGDLVCFLNADDVFFDNKVLESIANEWTGEDIIFGDVNFFYPIENKNVRISRNFSIADLKKGYMPPHQGAFVKRSILIELPFDTKYRSSADFDFFCRAAKKGVSSKKISTIISVVASGGISSGGVSYRETEAVVKKYFGLVPYLILLVKHKAFISAKKGFDFFGVKFHKG